TLVCYSHKQLVKLNRMEATTEVSCWGAMEAGASLVPFSYKMGSTPGSDEVDIKITHCGVCHSDVHQIDDAWKLASFPLVPGHEIIGNVVAVGADATHKLQLMLLSLREVQF
ncbi:hypothetical protein CYMTET_36634, partial [Cymbomonas tetramitiformis]